MSISTAEASAAENTSARVARVPRDATIVPRSSLAWAKYFQGNSASGRTIPWELGVNVSREELATIASSLQCWQLGETSDGRRLRAAAARYAEMTGDAEFVDAIDGFIREEHHHSEMLGRFLDLAGVGRIQAYWGDRLFRAARYWRPSMEVRTMPVVMVETLALVYYNAVRRATTSPVLRAVCSRILADEMPHIQFQCEQLARMFCNRSRIGRFFTFAIHRAAFLVVMTLVWFGHSRVLRAGGYTGRHFWRTCWDRMNRAWRLMDPARYDWSKS